MSVTPGQGKREQRAEADGERQRDAEQSQARPQVRREMMQPYPGSVREQHEHQRHLSQDLHHVLAGRDTQRGQRAMGQQQARRGEHDRRGHVEAFPARRQRAPREYQPGNDRQLGDGHRMRGISVARLRSTRIGGMW